jgi:hypothetical protein
MQQILLLSSNDEDEKLINYISLREDTISGLQLNKILIFNSQPTNQTSSPACPNHKTSKHFCPRPMQVWWDLSMEVVCLTQDTHNGQINQNLSFIQLSLPMANISLLPLSFNIVPCLHVFPNKFAISASSSVRSAYSLDINRLWHWVFEMWENLYQTRLLQNPLSLSLSLPSLRKKENGRSWECKLIM